MLEVFGTLQVRLVSLASDSKNRIWMDRYILCCSFLENAVQILQNKIRSDQGYHTMVEYERELTTHIDMILKIFDKKDSVTEDMTIWLMLIVSHLLFLKSIIFNPDPSNLVKLLNPLQKAKVGIKENRIIMEGAVTWVEKKMVFS